MEGIPSCPSSELINTTGRSLGFGITGNPGNGGGGAGALLLMLKWPSLEGLVLEAVRDEQAAAGWSACNSGRTTCRTLQVSWCSMKLSTLLKQ